MEIRVELDYGMCGSSVIGVYRVRRCRDDRDDRQDIRLVCLGHILYNKPTSNIKLLCVHYKAHHIEVECVVRGQLIDARSQIRACIAAIHAIITRH